MSIKYILTVSFFFISFSLFSQETIQVKGSVSKDSIMLRWAPSSQSLWKQLNKSGVRVERRTVVRNGEVLPVPEVKVFYEILKAKPLTEWEGLVGQNDYAAIIAQALYGEAFEISGSKNDLSTIVALSEESEQRFAMSLYAADQSFEAALFAGWGLVDKDIKAGERYLYNIILLAKPSVSGMIFLVTDEVNELPKPLGLTGIWGDKSVMLAWDYGMLKDDYNSYFIERSDNGKDFVRLDGIPVTNMNNKESKPAQRMYFIDSISDNLKRYSYQIKGITAFGETGPPSEPISGKGKSLLRYNPSITRSVINDNNELELEWEFEEAGNSLINGFTLNKSNHSEGGENNYVAVVENIAPQKRSLVFNQLEASNYFTITANAKEGESTSSFPVLVQPIDSTPPAIPKGLVGIIDTAGIVTLRWQKNEENDLLGYKVYRAFTASEELMPLFDLALEDTIYTEKTDLLNLNSKIYYTVASLDMRYNQSDMTTKLELTKPDLIKPIPPLISGYKITTQGIRLEWQNSPDTSVVQHRIYRKDKSETYTSDILLKTIQSLSVNFFVDSTARKGVRYIYTAKSLKKNWLESDPSNAVTLFTNKGKEPIELKKFNATIDKTNRLLKLDWEDDLNDVANYEIYRGANNEKPVLWEVISSETKAAFDDQLFVNTSYKYLIRAVLNNGEYSKIKELLITY